MKGPPSASPRNEHLGAMHPPAEELFSAMLDATDTENASLRLRQLVATCPDAVLFIDRSGTILLANPAACRMFGYLPDELRGADVRVLMSEPYARNHHAYIERYEATGQKKAIGKIRQVSAGAQTARNFPLSFQ